MFRYELKNVLKENYLTPSPLGEGWGGVKQQIPL